MATLANFRTSIAYELGIKSDTASHADQTEADRRLNEAVRDFLLKTGVKVTTRNVTLAADTGDYTLDSAVLLIKSARITSGDGNRMEQVSPAQIEDWRATANATTTDTVTYYALDGNDLLLVYPTPSAAGTIRLHTVEAPTAMSDAAHDPSDATYGGIPTVFHPALEAYALWKLGSADDDQSSAQGQRYKNDYEQGVRDARKYTNVKGNVRLPRAQVGRRRIRPSDPSADVYLW